MSPQYLRHGQQASNSPASEAEQVGTIDNVLTGRDYGAGRRFGNAGRLAAETAETGHPGHRAAPVLAHLENARV